MKGQLFCLPDKSGVGGGCDMLETIGGDGQGWRGGTLLPLCLNSPIKCLESQLQNGGKRDRQKGRGDGADVN